MKRRFFYVKQYIHNTLSMLTVSFAILAMAGWIESDHYFLAAGAIAYIIIWTIAQYIPGKDGRRHNKTLFN